MTKTNLKLFFSQLINIDVYMLSRNITVYEYLLSVASLIKTYVIGSYRATYIIDDFRLCQPTRGAMVYVLVNK